MGRMNADVSSLLKEITSKHYAIGELVAYEQLHLGYVNVSYIVEAGSHGERNKYFLRRYKKGIREEEVEFEHSIINHLTRKGFSLVAAVFSTRDGKTYVKRPEQGEDVFYAVFDFLPGEDKYTWDHPACSDEELRNAAAVLAQFHSAVFDLKPAGKRHEPKIIDLLPVIAANVERCTKKAGKTDFDLYLLENSGPVLETIERTRRAIEGREYEQIVHRVIHCDYHPGNLKFQNSEITGLFDFDWSKVDARCFDVALAITYFCTAWEGKEDGDLQLNKAAAFLDAYQDTLEGTPGVGPLSDVELKYLPPMMHASNVYVLNWALEDFYGKEVNPDAYLRYLRHNVRLMRWLEDKSNRDQLERREERQP